MNRRDNLKLFATALGAGILLGKTGAFAQTPAAPLATPPAGPFKLPPLGYPTDALEPHIDAATMMIHHDRHHQAYVANCNVIAEKWAGMTASPIEKILSDLSSVPESVRAGVRNNLGGHWNHTFFWEMMSPGGAKEPGADLKNAIEAAFGGVPQMMEKINASGAARFGSGWAWLVFNKDKKLEVVSTANQDTPLELGAKPVIGVDVWEHAYYLKYQNKRADYLKSWWNVVNWDKANANFKSAAG